MAHRTWFARLGLDQIPLHLERHERGKLAVEGNSTPSSANQDFCLLAIRFRRTRN